jgi:hypothetical protein
MNTLAEKKFLVTPLVVNATGGERNLRLTDDVCA